MLNTILLGIIAIELGIIVWNTRKKKTTENSINAVMDKINLGLSKTKKRVSF
ncbi:hypothetical protein [Sebaldella sp. S0638]|uniref:hypothetical protein n=1 Tax=Sebaldella sp. S0638 TaxID=2957809 RepID=UPI00209D455F|nr:hypothetical protein [Sebaldella sp. S0638]MCP1225409.1 hypothetical protein [Sebaldella sp. S0638]